MDANSRRDSDKEVSLYSLLGRMPQLYAQARALRPETLRTWGRQYLPMFAIAAMHGTGRVLSRIPRRWRYFPADTFTLPVALLLIRRRPVIARNFAAVLGCSATDPRVQALARTSIKNFGRMAIDFLISSTQPPEAALRWINVQGYEHLSAALQAGHGAIFALPHLGSWDVAATFCPARGLHLTVVTENDWSARLVAGFRTSQGVTVAPRSGSLRVLFRALKRNECVALLCDIAKEGLPTADVPFFGSPAPFPLGPAHLAQSTGAPILVITSVRQTDGSYLLQAQAPLWPDRYGQGDSAALALTADLAAGFERIVSAYPEHWYPFHPIWQGR